MTPFGALHHSCAGRFAGTAVAGFGAALLALLSPLALPGQNPAADRTHETWADYGGGPDSSQYSSLRQINSSNVSQLEIAWTFPTGDDNRYFFNPVEAHGLTYVLAEDDSIVALDAETGKKVWAHPAEPHTEIMTDRGINYWESADGRERRLLFASNHFLQAIDARTGKQILSFGTNGRVNLKEGLDRDPETLSLVQSTTPGRVFENLLILGSATNQGYGSAPGDIRAFDVRTGKLLWYFQMVHHDIWDYDNAAAPKLLTVWHDGHQVDAVAQAGKTGYVWVFDRVTGKPLWPIEERPEPRSDVPGEETWPTQPFPTNPPPFARRSFTVADLSPLITDPQEAARFRQQIESSRNSGLFTPPALADTMQMPGNSGGANWGSTAADPSNGTLVIASMDLPCLLKLEREQTGGVARGETIEQQGHFIFESNCRLCHGSGLKGLPPAIPSLVDIGSRLNRDQIAARIRQGRGPMPGFPKLADADVQSLVAFLLNPSEALNSSPQPAATSAAGTESADSQPVRYLSGFGFMMTTAQVPPIKPPWSSLTAYDLNTGTIKWQVPLGEVPELAAKGVPNTGFPFLKTGPIMTAGGLIFTATRDHFVRAYDEQTGKVLWEKRLDTPMQGMPSVYEAGGREYLVVCAAAPEVNDAAAQQHIHGAYVAFALPRNASGPHAAR